MKKMLSMALALLLALSLCSGALAENRLEKIQAAGKITVATSPDFAPSEFVDPNKTGQDAIVGSEMSLARYIAQELGVELVIESMDFSAVQGAVTTGKVDLAISGFSRTEERAESMELSDFYTFIEDKGQGILIRAADAELYKTAEDFAGKKIAVQNASLQYNLLTTQLPDAVPELITNLNDAVMMLITGKVDAVGVAVGNGEAYVKNYPELMLSEFYYDHKDVGNVLAATKGEVELIAAVNEILLKAKEEDLLLGWYNEAVELADSLGLND